MPFSLRRLSVNLIASLLVFAVSAGTSSAQATAAECDASDPSSVCGVDNAEDLIRLPGTPWIIASYTNWTLVDGRVLFNKPGPLRAVRMDTREVSRLFPEPGATIDWDRETYSECPGPPNDFLSAGLNVRPLNERRFRLYAVNLGGRNSIEIIDLTPRKQELLATWRGCVLTPYGRRPNSVVPLPDDGFAASFMTGGGAETWESVRGWRKINGLAENDLGNGIEASPDAKWLFLAVLNAVTMKKAVIRVPVDGGEVRTVIESQDDYVLDNLRRGEDGQLYLMRFRALNVEDCRNTDAGKTAGFSIVQIDPQTLSSREVLRSDGIAGAWGCSTVALQLGERFWIGFWSGDRIAILPVPADANDGSRER